MPNLNLMIWAVCKETWSNHKPAWTTVPFRLSISIIVVACLKWVYSWHSHWVHEFQSCSRQGCMSRLLVYLVLLAWYEALQPTDPPSKEPYWIITVGFQVITPMDLNSSFLCNVMPCSLPAPCFMSLFANFLAWRWMRYVPAKCLLPFNAIRIFFSNIYIYIYDIKLRGP